MPFAFDDADIASFTAMIYYGVEHYFNGLYGRTNDDDVNAMDETLIKSIIQHAQYETSPNQNDRVCKILEK